MAQTQPKTLPSGLALLSQGMAYVKYGRLMILLGILGCLSGPIYFVHTPAVYYSKALFDIKFFALPISSDGAGITVRNVLRNLGSRQMIAWTAHRIGVGQPTDSFESLRNGPLKKVGVSMLDGYTISIDVYSRKPWVVRQFPMALIDQYESYYREQRLAFMDVAVKKYQDEMKELRNKVDEKFKGQVDFERKNQVTSVMIEQNALAQVPLDILRTQHKLRKHEEIGSIIDERRKTGLETIEELSLLESAKRAMDTVSEGNTGQLLPASDLSGALSNVAAGLSNNRPTVVVQPSMVAGLTPWQILEKEMRGLEVKIKEAARTYLEGHQVMKGLRENVRTINEKLLSELNVERQHFEVDRLRLREELTQLEARLPEYSKVTEKLAKLRQDYTLGEESDLAWSKGYTDLAKMVTSMNYGVDKERVDMQFREFTHMRDQDPVSPTKSKLLMIALSMGIGLALGVPFLLEQLNDRVGSIDVLEAATGEKGIGIVPKSNSEFLEDVTRPVESTVSKPNHVLECYRVLRAQLFLQLEQKQGTKVVMLTSSRPSEGKTVTATNLAWALQCSGLRTLVVDLDFRRGRQHKLFKVGRAPGFCQALTGEMKLQDVVRHTSLPNLDYVTRGNTVAGSSELLCRLGLEEAIAEWKKEYDWIILDTPPVLGLSETTSLQRVADGIVLVVKSDSTHRRDVLDALAQIRKSGARIFGMVLNNVDLDKISNYYYYYYSSAYYYQAFDDHEEAEKKGDLLKGTPA